MTFVLLRKLLRDVRVGWAVVAFILVSFELVWARVTERIAGEILASFERLGVSVETLRDIVFQGPGEIVQAIMGGADIKIERAADMLSIGYVHPFVLMVLCVWAVSRPAGAIAGELERGTMELLLAQPIRRSQVMLAHVLLDVLTLPPLSLCVWVGTWAGAWMIGALAASRPFLHVDPWAFAPALLAVAGLLFSISGPTLWLSSLGRARLPVWGLAVSLLLVQFLINVIAQLWGPLAPLRYLTVFNYYQPQEMILQADWAQHAVVWLRLAVLYSVGSAGYVLAWFTFCRRDLPAPL